MGYFYEKINRIAAVALLLCSCGGGTVSDWINEEETVNTVDIFNADGTKETIENLSFNEVKKVYSDYLGVDYDALYDNMNYPAYQCMQGDLLVPDADNLTDVDIYNCVLSLLEKYDEESVR